MRSSMGLLTLVALLDVAAVSLSKDLLLESLETESFRGNTNREAPDDTSCTVSAEGVTRCRGETESRVVAAGEPHDSGQGAARGSGATSGVRKSSRSPTEKRNRTLTSTTKRASKSLSNSKSNSTSNSKSPLLSSLLDVGADVAARARAAAFATPRGCLLCGALVSAVLTVLLRVATSVYAWLRKTCCERGKKGAASFLTPTKPQEFVRVLICAHWYAWSNQAQKHRLYAFTWEPDGEGKAPPKGLLQNTQFRDGVPFVASAQLMADKPSVLEVIVSQQHPVLQFVVCLTSNYVGKEKIIGLASIDLEKLEAKQFNFSNDLLEAHLSGGRVGSLDVSMWKYVKPPGFKLDTMWGRLACCLDQARKQIPPAESASGVSSIAVLSYMLSGYFMVDDTVDTLSYEQCYFEAAFKKERWYWIWYQRRGGERKGFIPFGSLISMRAHPTEDNTIILRYSKKGEAHEMFIAPLASPEGFADAVRGRDELMFAIWKLREKRSESPAAKEGGSENLSAEDAQQGASGSDTDGSEASDISRVSVSPPGGPVPEGAVRSSRGSGARGSGGTVKSSGPPVGRGRRSSGVR